MTDLKQLKQKIHDFNEERDWMQFHSPQNLAKSIAIEAGELLECFQWSEDFDKEAVCEEMADVYTYLLDLSEALGVDLIEITDRKMDKNALKYPVDKARGSSVKYDKLK
ncbi:MAG: nucleotide pyrophosphohydrolase [Erysipelotrichaceae bacterium]|jgi:NTP pyrophosphatase (non-canonical NTP hydrolase)|nr:nucleotide pyrophosphohydrolase [Erysipelotrichaceae bacterium]